MRFTMGMVMSASTAVAHRPRPGNNGHPDGALMVQIGRGDTEALHALHTRYDQWVCRLAYRLTRDHATTEEVAQDVWLAVWRSAATFQPERPFDAWLFGIVSHRAIDAMRSRVYRAREHEISLSTVLNIGTSFVADNIEDDLILRQALHQALATLPHAQRETLQLAQAGWSAEAIARGLGRPLGTVKAQRQRGLQKLRVLLAGE